MIRNVCLFNCRAHTHTHTPTHSHTHSLSLSLSRAHTHTHTHTHTHKHTHTYTYSRARVLSLTKYRLYVLSIHLSVYHLNIICICIFGDCVMLLALASYRCAQKCNTFEKKQTNKTTKLMIWEFWLVYLAVDKHTHIVWLFHSQLINSPLDISHVTRCVLYASLFTDS